MYSVFKSILSHDEDDVKVITNSLQTDRALLVPEEVEFLDYLQETLRLSHQTPSETLKVSWR